MRDRYQPGHVLVLPSGRRVVIQQVKPQQLVCQYQTHRPGDRRHGVMAHDADMLLTRLFADRHTLLVPVAEPQKETVR